MTDAHAEIDWLSAAARRATPWKNGGGVTWEIAAAPAGAGLDAFDWRVSTAEVRGAGKFSSFPGIDRTLCVLEGVLQLSLYERAPVVLNEASPPFEFPGDAPAHAVPEGLVTDLNVMVRRGAFTAGVKRWRGPGKLALHAERTLVFAAQPQILTFAERSYSLAAGDALCCRGAQEARLVSDYAVLYVIELTRAARLPV
jgi:environmental stress-induced protein Ves